MAGAKMVTQKKNQNFFSQTDNPIEIIKDFGIGVVKSAANDLLGGAVNSATEQLGLTPSSKTPKSEGELKPNQEVNLDKLPNTMWFGEKKPLSQFNETAPVRQMEVEKKIEEILRELHLLAKSVAKIETQAAKIAVEQAPIKGGIYHANFFEWILKLIKTARAKVDESSLWLEHFQTRKSQKQYWAMFKKHGTNFALSNERSLATQTG